MRVAFQLMLNISGMVDLIVCYDASASPTRLVQRMGRAARKRDGSIVVLLTEGKEENVCFFFHLTCFYLKAYILQLDISLTLVILVFK